MRAAPITIDNRGVSRRSASRRRLPRRAACTAAGRPVGGVGELQRPVDEHMGDHCDRPSRQMSAVSTRFERCPVEGCPDEAGDRGTDDLQKASVVSGVRAGTARKSS